MKNPPPLPMYFLFLLSCRLSPELLVIDVVLLLWLHIFIASLCQPSFGM